MTFPEKAHFWSHFPQNSPEKGASSFQNSPEKGASFLEKKRFYDISRKSPFLVSFSGKERHCLASLPEKGPFVASFPAKKGCVVILFADKSRLYHLFSQRRAFFINVSVRY
jgi:hypothetical protein